MLALLTHLTSQHLFADVHKRQRRNFKTDATLVIVHTVGLPSDAIA